MRTHCPLEVCDALSGEIVAVEIDGEQLLVLFKAGHQRLTSTVGDVVCPQIQGCEAFIFH